MRSDIPILKAIAAGTFPQYIDESHKDFEIFEGLYENGFVTAFKSSTDNSYTMPRLLPAGYRLTKL